MPEFSTKSGAKCTINVAPWEDARKLKSALLRELAKAGIKLDGTDKSAAGTSLLSAFMLVDGSEEVYQALLPCFARSLYKGLKITESLFDDAAAREDYYELACKVIEVNLYPLFKSLLSLLPSGLVSQVKAATKLESDQK